MDERTGIRDLSYSAWHRVRSIARFVGVEQAQSLSMVDADVVLFLEVDPRSRSPLALIEVAIDVEQTEKPASSTARLAALAGLPAFTVLYRRSVRLNPADRRELDIDRFRVRRLWPSPEHSWRTLSPEDWAKALVEIRKWSAAKIDLSANDPTWEPVPEQRQLFEHRA
jgi:hypothetical protein